VILTIRRTKRSNVRAHRASASVLRPCLQTPGAATPSSDRLEVTRRPSAASRTAGGLLPRPAPSLLTNEPVSQRALVPERAANICKPHWLCVMTCLQHKRHICGRTSSNVCTFKAGRCSECGACIPWSGRIALRCGVVLIHRALPPRRCGAGCADVAPRVCQPQTSAGPATPDKAGRMQADEGDGEMAADCNEALLSAASASPLPMPLMRDHRAALGASRLMPVEKTRSQRAACTLSYMHASEG